MFEEATGSMYDKTIFAPPEYDVTQSRFYRALVTKRARRANWYGGSFINDRGFRHIKNHDDLSGVTYAFWLIREKSSP